MTASSKVKLGPGALYPHEVAWWRDAIADEGIAMRGLERPVQSCSELEGGCGGRCCLRGISLSEASKETLEAFVVERIDDLSRLGGPRSVEDCFQRTEAGGWQTAVRDVPDVQEAQTTRACAFLNGHGLCTLHSLALEDGHDPYAYKPTPCWLYPIHVTIGTRQDERGEAHRKLFLNPFTPEVNEPNQEQFPCVQPRDEGTPVWITGVDSLDAFGQLFGMDHFAEDVAHEMDPATKRVGRNDPCWCGSGRKRKHCDRHR